MIRRLQRFARVAAALAAVLLALVHLTPFTPWMTSRLTIWDNPAPPHGTLVVLGGEQNADGTLGIMSYWRCIYAVRAWRTGQFAKVLISGAASHPPPQPSDPPPPPLQLAAAMAEFIGALGVPQQAIVIEPASSSTRLNAIKSAPLLRSLPAPYTLITSDFHSFRAQRCFRRAGLTVYSQPAPDLLKRTNDWHQRWPCTVALAEEWMKIVYYWWQGWI